MRADATVTGASCLCRPQTSSLSQSLTPRSELFMFRRCATTLGNSSGGPVLSWLTQKSLIGRNCVPRCFFSAKPCTYFCLTRSPPPKKVLQPHGVRCVLPWDRGGGKLLMSCKPVISPTSIRSTSNLLLHLSFTPTAQETSLQL